MMRQTWRSCSMNTYVTRAHIRRGRVADALAFLRHHSCGGGPGSSSEVRCLRARLAACPTDVSSFLLCSTCNHTICQDTARRINKVRDFILYLVLLYGYCRRSDTSYYWLCGCLAVYCLSMCAWLSSKLGSP